jgi:hypothetical protein
MSGHEAAQDRQPPGGRRRGAARPHGIPSRRGRRAAPPQGVQVRGEQAVPGRGRTARTTRAGADYGPDCCPSRLLPVLAAKRIAAAHGGTGHQGPAHPNSSELWHSTACPHRRWGSHLGSPLGPGRPVLIRSVSRRVGSVACVREDASPNEVSVQTAVTIRPDHPGHPIHDQTFATAPVRPRTGDGPTATGLPAAPAPRSRPRPPYGPRQAGRASNWLIPASTGGATR